MNWPEWAQYALSLGSVAAALAVNWAFSLLPDGHYPFVLVSAALLLLVVLVRPGPFLAGAAAACLGSWFLFLSPAMSFRVDDPRDMLLLGVYVLVLVAVALTARHSGHVRDRVHEAREALRVTLASIGDAVISTDTRGRITFLNNIAAELTGWPPEQAHGRPINEVFKIVNEQTHGPVDNPAEKVLAEGRIIGLANHSMLIRSDGREVPIDDSAAPILDSHGNISGSVLVFRDVTERRKAENALRRSEQELSEFFENASIGLHWAAPDGTILRANQTELEMLGYSREEYVGHNIAEFHVERLVAEDMFARLAAGETLRNYEARLRSKDGSIREVLVNCNVLFEDGRFVHTRCFTRDITEIKQAQNTQARLAAIVESSDDAIVGKSLQGIIQSWNAGAERIFGYTAEQAIGRHISLIIPPERAAEEDAIMSKLRAGERVDHFESVRVRSDGRKVCVSLTISPIRDDRGRVVGASKIARDITARQRAEQALRKSEQSLRLALEAGQMGTWEWLIDTGQAAGSSTVLSMHGLDPENFPGTMNACWKGIHPDDREKVQQSLQRALDSDKDHQVEYRVIWPDGSVRWLEARGRVIRSDAGAPVRMAGVCADITARKLADYAIRESEERFRLMANAAPVLIWISGTDRSWTWLNRQWLEFVGRPIEQETGKGWSEHVHPDDLDRCLKRYTSSFNKRESFSMEFRLRRRDGEYRWVLNTGVPRYDSQGIFAGYIGSCLDITERKRSEQALRAADRRKDEFLAMLAHELRNPLAPIRNSLEILKRSEDDPGALRQGRDVIERQVSHLVRLVDDLIDVSRITRDKLELRKTRVELASILHQALDTCRPLAARENQVIELALPAQPIYLDADPVRLAQVFSNLLNNACKYTPPHGKISITAEVRDSEVTVSVKDTGIGIPPEKLNRIFEMFVQIDPSLEGASGGLGIGLTLAKRLVELHHGQISASSGGAGAGSMFTVRLPILLQTAQPSNHPGAGPPEAVVGVRILVVDDNQDSALSLAELLRLMGHEVHVVHDGLEAVKTADEFRPALALLDIGLPGMNGYEVCRSIRQQAWGREMVLVALTGWGQDEDQKKAMAAGFNHHLIKPPAFDVLSRLIGELSRRENRAFSDA